jgi:L-threonylcarbamoyladenylate synthase
MNPIENTDQIIKQCIGVLQKSGTILYPTDTIWGIGCDATNEEAVNKVYRIKKRIENKSLIILLDSMDRLSDYVETVPGITKDLIDGIETPLTIIYPGGRNLARNILASDGSIAVRIIRNKFCRQLIERFGKPIVSTSANISGQSSPLLFKHISPEIVNEVDYIVPLYQDELREVKPSTIIRLKQNGEFEIIRK